MMEIARMERFFLAQKLHVMMYAIEFPRMSAVESRCEARSIAAWKTLPETMHL